MKTTTVHTRVEDSDLKKIKKIAKEEGVSVGVIIRKAIKQVVIYYKILKKG